MLRCTDRDNNYLLTHEEDPWEAVDVDADHDEGEHTHLTILRHWILLGLRQYVILDVGGERFQGCRDHFIKYPKTRLGRLMKTDNVEEILSLCDEYVPGKPPEYFFDRNPENFPSVLEMYRSGQFHIPDSAKCNHPLLKIS